MNTLTGPRGCRSHRCDAQDFRLRVQGRGDRKAAPISNRAPRIPSIPLETRQQGSEPLRRTSFPYRAFLEDATGPGLLYEATTRRPGEPSVVL